MNTGKSTEIFLVTPPFTQLNTPYPATAYLKGFFNTLKIHTEQCDLGIETILRLFSHRELGSLFSTFSSINKLSGRGQRILSLKESYLSTIDSVIAFLQYSDATMAYRISERNFLPEGSRFSQLDDLDWAFGNMGVQDKARYLATLYLEDIGDFIHENIDPHFGFSRYAERLGRSANEFDEIYRELKKEITAVEKIMLEILHSKLETINPKLVCFSVPFPGNLFSAFRCAQYIKKHFPGMKIAMGGGFPNTELRSLRDPRVFEFFDYITLDDGERPLLNLVEFQNGKRKKENLKRTFMLSGDEIILQDNSTEPDFSLRETGTPDYSGLPLKKYLSVIEITNPMHRLWSDGRWNKLTLAHGCYWGKCTFCDISLDYIQRYEPANAKMICDRVEELIRQTGETGFHFVDEAAPPSLLKEFSLELLRRNLKISWWTNIRFEKSFTDDLCRLMNASGCIAVSGGLEVASDRLLDLIEKGVTVEQVAKVTGAFTDAGIKVHAYLMFGYPTQTDQETVDSLEMVRQLFEAGIIQSGFWHRFALTAHSPVAANPDKYKIEILNESLGNFANNDLEYEEESGVDHEKFSEGLRKSLFNFMNGIGFEFPLQDWFDFKIPKTKIKKDFVASVLDSEIFFSPSDHQKCYWIAGQPEIITGKKYQWVIRNIKSDIVIKLKPETGQWLEEIFSRFSPASIKPISVKELGESYVKKFNQPFALFLHSGEMEQLRAAGLLIA